MIVLSERPPLFDEIDAKFNVRGKPVIFSWGNRIYYPTGGQIHPSIMAHEKAHCERQGANEPGIVLWWRSYLDDKEFRLAEEILGHAAELRWHLDRCSGRNDRRRFISMVAAKLAAPLYGSIISLADAKQELKRHVD